ncbi:MAG: histidine phosphatase family protein [Pseudochelatococcus sp.]|jgi:broad specificity phosphatase PhoE|uniref:histidine phosphatase family protein n=1 Tax=Pseudochelatococcus sp. TaxID=2020869 RepID=UPI003D93CC99
MATVYFVTHPEVVIDPAVPVPQWPLSEKGITRLDAFCARPELAQVSDVFVSDERKALDCAERFGAARGLDFNVDAQLGENDRSSTGYVAPPRFWEIVAAFFDNPHESILGWERAVDAQSRIKTAVRRCIGNRTGDGDVLIFSHGGVGSLLLCDLLGEPISNGHGQPVSGGGCYFTFQARSGELLHGWRDIVPAGGG